MKLNGIVEGKETGSYQTYCIKILPQALNSQNFVMKHSGKLVLVFVLKMLVLVHTQGKKMGCAVEDLRSLLAMNAVFLQ